MAITQDSIDAKEFFLDDVVEVEPEPSTCIVCEGLACADPSQRNRDALQALTYFRVLKSEAAAWFLSRLAAFFSFAVLEAGFLPAFWPLSLDIHCPSY